MWLLFTLFLLRTLTRNSWLAVLLFVALLVGTTHLNLVATVVYLLITAFVLLRFGLLALVVGDLVFHVIHATPWTADLSVWYSGPTVFAYLAIVGLAGLGFHAVLGDRPLLRAELLEA
jgi:hypothetical protein